MKSHLLTIKLRCRVELIDMVVALDEKMAKPIDEKIL